ncbi:hypothetical protein CEN49_02370 [Fischerella thermalis CCMEE 5273]|jgi:HAE1 family hydrophobic/amphiphilic exporter-1|uniref:Uncharacterized protein n=2 Tax=Chlorogloeopsis fritschii TaxID=1124 RepID=A0A3S1A1X6_CHLFR|nr:hypothetical protein CEN49_02370 [Fischerella thermalis CCMEE 5273]PMB49988.1 hypothetical protein CEN40_03400 [Fischerella thermalis CCMEE 5205]RUR83695.1 hypothetical protein PCC6912_19380 [Chlorogloeopsis fritschii PCC 6912]
MNADYAIAFLITPSTFNAITFTPAVSAILLRRGQQRGWLGWFFARVNDLLDWMHRGYQRILGTVTRFQMANIPRI